MKKLILPVMSFALLVAGNSAGAQTKTTTTTVKKTTKSTGDTMVAGHHAMKHHAKHHHHSTVKGGASQQEETIMLDNSDEKTVVEIQHGGVYVNGDLISTIKDANKENHKIVINVKEKKSPADPGMTELPMEAQPKRKAMLGVMTIDDGADNGARIRTVISNSPADKAGLKNGDIITKVGDADVKNSVDLMSAVNSHEQGESVEITYKRDGSEATTHTSLDGVSMAIISDIGNNNMMSDMDDDMSMGMPGRMRDRRVDDENEMMYHHHHASFNEAMKMGIVASDEGEERGVLIKTVKPNSPAETAGLKKGDIIIWLDHKRTHTVEDVHAIMSYSWPEERMKVVVKRGGDLVTVHMILTRHGKKNL